MLSKDFSNMARRFDTSLYTTITALKCPSTGRYPIVLLPIDLLSLAFLFLAMAPKQHLALCSLFVFIASCQCSKLSKQGVREQGECMRLSER